MSKPRSQRYRLTLEFVLEDRGAYVNVRDAFERALADVTCLAWPIGTPRSQASRKLSRICADYFSIKKVNK